MSSRDLTVRSKRRFVSFWRFFEYEGFFVLGFYFIHIRKGKEFVFGASDWGSPFFSGEFSNPLIFSDLFYTFSGQIHSGFVQSVL